MISIYNPNINDYTKSAKEAIESGWISNHGVFIEKAKNIANKHQIKVHEGIYVGVTGPTFETRAEYKLIKAVGGDVVGMSTVQENIAAVHAGMKVFAISVVTDLGIREDNNTITHQEVLEAAHAAEPKLTLIISDLVKQIS